jgi:hypothetical protein
MARRRNQADGETVGMVPPEFAELFEGVPEDALGARLGGWMAQRYGSSRAYLYWLVELAAKADRESVRFDAVAKIITLLHGEAPQELILTAKKDPQNGKPPAALQQPNRVALLVDTLARVGFLPAAAAAVRAGGPPHAEVEQVPPADR